MNNRLEKFEFVNGEVYHVVSKCVMLDNTRYALELVTKTNDETLFEAYGKGTFVKAICDMNEKMYIDDLTGLKNRRYYNEQKALLNRAEAMALIDIDNFKRINDNYGHLFGDVVLKEVARCVKESVRKSDTVVRYGGDEIYVIFHEMREVDHIEYVYRRKKYGWTKAQFIVARRDADGSAMNVIFTVRDINEETETRIKKQEAEQEALHDSLTQTWNRKAFDQFKKMSNISIISPALCYLILTDLKELMINLVMMLVIRLLLP